MRRIFIIVTSIVRLVKSAAHPTLDSARSVAYNPRALASCRSLWAPRNLSLDLEETELALTASWSALTSPSQLLSEGRHEPMAHINMNVAAHSSTTAVR
jgi:hypothetical protein